MQSGVGATNTDATPNHIEMGPRNGSQDGSGKIRADQQS